MTFQDELITIRRVCDATIYLRIASFGLMIRLTIAMLADESITEMLFTIESEGGISRNDLTIPAFVVPAS